MYSEINVKEFSVSVEILKSLFVRVLLCILFMPDKNRTGVVEGIKEPQLKTFCLFEGTVILTINQKRAPSARKMQQENDELSKDEGAKICIYYFIFN